MPKNEKHDRTKRPESIVFLHTRSWGQHDWLNETLVFKQIPAVGEIVAHDRGPRGKRLDDGARHFRVYHVVHCAFDSASFDAEVYAVEVDHLKAQLEDTPDRTKDD
jgi:hypothetical protein